MIAHIKELIPLFGGAATCTHCFLHVVNLVVKSILHEFDAPQPGNVVNGTDVEPDIAGSKSDGERRSLMSTLILLMAQGPM